jgi:hypothetical protein
MLFGILYFKIFEPHTNQTQTDLYGMSAGVAGLMFLPSKRTIPL